MDFNIAQKGTNRVQQNHQKSAQFFKPNSINVSTVHHIPQESNFTQPNTPNTTQTKSSTLSTKLTAQITEFLKFQDNKPKQPNIHKN